MPRMMMLRSGMTVIMMILLGGCGIFHDDSGGLAKFDLSVSTSRVWTSPSAPCTLTVRAENNGTARGVWGQGSSTCQLGAMVQVGHASYPMVISRVCTDDLAEQGLDAGASRTETWGWDGRIYLNGSEAALSARTYRVFGSAGLWRSAQFVDIEIRSSP